MERETKPQRRVNLWYVLLAFWLGLLVVDFVQFQVNYQSLPYSEFLTYVDQGRIESVAIGEQRLQGRLKNPPAGEPADFITVRVQDAALLTRLQDAKIKFSGIQENGIWKSFFAWMLPLFFFVAIFALLMRRGAGPGLQRGSGFLSMGKSRAKVYMEKDIKTRFPDAAGVDEAKEELSEIVNFLRDPQRYSKLGGRMPKGILLVGPPGTGKTLLARAVAGEAGVPFFSINGSEFVELFVGLGAARVRDLFEQARAQAPCIVFIDELDALGKARGLNAITGSGNDEKEQTLNQLLAEMDGFDSSTGIMLLAATNRPEVLDPALLRAGRFDRHVTVDKPDRLGRARILEIHLKAIRMAPDVSPETIASLTAGFSGADLANLVNEAALIATRRKAEAVELRDCTEAMERIVAGLERKNRLLGPAEKRRVAFHEMGHAIIAMSCGQSEAVHKVSIIPRGIGALGYTLRRPTEDRYLMSANELHDKLAVLLGGRVAESLVFEEVSTGAADDLDKATEIARAMITRYGMSGRLGLAILERESSPFLGQGTTRSFAYSEQTAQAIDAEVNRLLQHAFDRASETLRRFSDLLNEGALILINRETLDENELKDLWRKHQEAPLKPPRPLRKTG